MAWTIVDCDYCDFTGKAILRPARQRGYDQFVCPECGRLNYLVTQELPVDPRRTKIIRQDEAEPI
jgi:phage FluMu protein Com